MSEGIWTDNAQQIDGNSSNDPFAFDLGELKMKFIVHDMFSEYPSPGKLKIKKIIENTNKLKVFGSKQSKVNSGEMYTSSNNNYII